MMVVVRFSTIVAASRSSAWAYVANFANIAGWDPGVKSSTQISKGPPGVASEYELVTLFKGSESKMKYTVREWQPLTKAVFTADGDTVTAVDTIEFSDAPTAGHTKIDYTADIRLKGFLSLFTFMVAGDIRKLGDAAKAGLEKAFADGKHNSSG